MEYEDMQATIAMSEGERDVIEVCMEGNDVHLVNIHKWHTVNYLFAIDIFAGSKEAEDY